MVEKVNRVYFNQTDFNSISEMFDALYTQMLALAKNNYMCLTYKSPVESSVYVLEFASTIPTFNEDKLISCWITPFEASLIAKSRLKREKQDMKEAIKDALRLMDDDLDDDGDDSDDDKGGLPSA